MTSLLKPKHQRLVLAVIALAALLGAALLASYALRNQASYFYVPADIAASPPAAWRSGCRFRPGATRSINWR